MDGFFTKNIRAGVDMVIRGGLSEAGNQINRIKTNEASESASYSRVEGKEHT